MIGTEAQLVLNELKRFYEENGYMPTYREIMDSISLSSTSVVRTRLKELEEENLISIVWEKSRAMRIK